MTQDRSWIVQRRKGNLNDPLRDITEAIQVDYNKVVLSELPDEFKQLRVYNNEKELYIKKTGTADENSIVVDYKVGYVYFDSMYNGDTFTFEYSGAGGYYLNAKRVFIKEHEGSPTETLQGIADEMMDNSEIAKQTNDSILGNEQTRQNNESQRQQQEVAREQYIYNTKYVAPYSNSVAYKTNNIVSFNGASFIAKKATAGNFPPSDITAQQENEHWGLLARKGTDGNGTVHVHRDTFTATEGQRVFTLSKNYDPFQNRTNVTVGGVPQKTPENYEETSSTSITLSEGVPAGTIIEVKYFSEALPLQSDVQTAIDNHTNLLSSHSSQIESQASQLAQKATKGDIVSSDLRNTTEADRLGLSNLKEEVIQAMAGNASVNSIPANESVTIEKLAPQLQSMFVTEGSAW